MLVLCLAGIGVGLLVWGDDDGTPDASPSPTTPSTSSSPISAPTVTEGVELPVRITGERPELFKGNQAELDAALPPPPGQDASVTDKVLHELREDTLRLAGVPGRITAASCTSGKIPNKAGESTGCTIVYEGVEVTWAVVIESVGWTSVSYRKYPPKTAVLVDTGVYGAFWESYRNQSDELRCDTIPHISTVELDRDTGFKCQYLDRARSRWINVPVIVRQFGVQFS